MSLAEGQRLAPCPTCGIETIQEREAGTWVCQRCKALGAIATHNQKLKQHRESPKQIVIGVVLTALAIFLGWVLGMFD